MYWLLLPVAFVALWFGLRTPSPGAMAGWLGLTAVLVILWVYFRFRAVFPSDGASDYVLTPMDAEEIKRMKEQTQAQRAQSQVQNTPPAATTAQPRRDDDEPNLWLD